MLVKDIPGYEGLYAITEDGRVWSHRRVIAITTRSKKGKIYQTSQTWGGYFLRTSIDNVGYRFCALLKRQKQRTFRIHRLIAEAYLPRVSGKDEINHINGVKTDNHIENLEWCTHVENVQHAWRTGLVRQGRVYRGEENHKAILTAPQVKEIRILYPSISFEKIGKKYDVNWRTVRDIITGRTWKHVA